MNEILALVYSYARAAWRRRWWAVATAWVVALLAWSVVLMMPDKYEASARVFVDTQTPLRPVLDGIAIEDNYDSQLALVREALLSRPQLEAVARTTNLDAKVATQADMDALITALQERIQISAIAPNAGQGASRNNRDATDMIYTITYQNTDRGKSVEVVRTLLDNFRDGTQSGNRSDSSTQQEFLVQEIADRERRLQEAEKSRAEFKKRNFGMLPNERGDYFTRLHQEMQGEQEAQSNLAVALGGQAELQRQLANTRPYLPGTGGGGGSAVPDVTLRRLEAEQQLEAALLRWTPQHPNVIALQKNVAELTAREQKELADLQGGGTGTGAISSLNPNPRYQEIQTQLGALSVEIASHRAAAEQHRREIASLRRFVDQAPEVEQEMSRLNRDYDLIKDSYDQLVERREQQLVTDNAARTGIVRFDTIEPPRASLDPVAPNRQVLFLACLVLAFGAGIGLALVPQVLSPTIDDVASLERRFELPVLGAVSVLRSEAERAMQGTQIRLVAIAAAALVAAAGVLVVAGGAGSRFLQQFLV